MVENEITLIISVEMNETVGASWWSARMGQHLGS